MDDTSFLLSDEFLSLVEKVKLIQEEKKAKKAELKAFYDKVQAEIKALDVKAKGLEDELAAAMSKGK